MNKLERAFKKGLVLRSKKNFHKRLFHSKTEGDVLESQPTAPKPNLSGRVRRG